MSVDTNQENQNVATPSNDELNFAKLRQKYEAEKQARLEAEERIKNYEANQQAQKEPEEDDSYDYDYLDRKTFNKRVAQLEKEFESRISQTAEQKARELFYKQQQQQYFKENKDFEAVMNEKNIRELEAKYPHLTEIVDSLPDDFSKQKYVYNQIKALGIGQENKAQSSIQDRINQNRQSASYQPTGYSPAPGADTTVSDFSQVGQKKSWEKIQELKRRVAGLGN